MPVTIGAQSGSESYLNFLREQRESREREEMQVVFKELQKHGARLTWEFNIHRTNSPTTQDSTNLLNLLSTQLDHVTGYFSNRGQRDAAKKAISELNKNQSDDEKLTLSINGEAEQRDFLIKNEGQDSETEDNESTYALEVDFPKAYDYKNFLALAKKQPELARQFLTDLAETIAQNAAEEPLENNLETGAKKTFERIQSQVDAQENIAKNWISGAINTFFDTADLLGNIDTETIKILTNQIHDHADPAYQELIKKIQNQKTKTAYAA